MNQFEIRAATNRDADALSGFLNRCTLTHQGISRSSPADVVARLRQEGADPRFDSFVVRDSGEVVGFAHLWRHGTDEIKLFARTHPDARGRGVGSQLLQLCDRRAAALSPGARMTTTSWAADVDGPPLLQANGYTPIRYFLKMEIAADSVPERAPIWPTGVECIPLSERQDLTGAVYVAWQDAFAGHWGRGAESEAEFWQEHRDSKLGSAFPFDPTLWLLACVDGAVIGFCLCEIGSSEGALVGRVAEIGVVSSQRGAGIGYALLLSGFRVLRRRGAATIVLDVDAENVTSALRLYEKGGMTPRPAFTIWEKARPSKV